MASKHKMDAEYDELKGYRESTLGYIVRFIPRAIFRGLCWFNSGGENMFLKGTLAPVDKEVFAKDLPVVEGAVPSALQGTYIRTGSNPQYKAWGGYHWFDGEGMVHAVHLEGGVAKTYCNHWVRCKRWLYETAAGCNLFLRFGDLQGILGLFIMMFFNAFRRLLVPTGEGDQSTGQLGNTAVVWHGNRLLALMEGGFPFLLRLCSGAVRSIGEHMFGGSLKHEFTAHPKVDATTGDMAAFAYKIGGKIASVNAQIAYFTVSPKGVMSKEHPVELGPPQMIHDFAISEKYAVFTDGALVFDGPHMVKSGKSPFFCDKKKQCRMGLLQRAAPEKGLQFFDIDTMVYFHYATAWDDGAKTHVVLSKYDELDLGLGASEQQKQPGTMVRYTLDTVSGTATCTRLIQSYDMEFPIVPPNLVAKPLKYCYCTGREAGSAKGVGFSLIAKLDMTAEQDAGLMGLIKLPEGYFGGEFSFTARPGGTDESDGWLVGFCTDSNSMKSYLSVYDAKTMSETPVAKVLMPQRVPLGFHGTFIPLDALKAQRTDEYVATNDVVNGVAVEA